ncbi:MAG TPA: hypothetical protein VEG38_17120 [Acidimicrobiia bacterium]|nr:hypothetical protein [Acidimicrobiia bacterium]
MPRAAKPTRLPGGGLSMATEPDYFVKQGDFQALAAGRPAMFYRDLSKALADWEAGWRELFLSSFPGSVEAIDAALGFDPEADLDDEDDDEDDDDDEDGPAAG